MAGAARSGWRRAARRSAPLCSAGAAVYGSEATARPSKDAGDRTDGARGSPGSGEKSKPWAGVGGTSTGAAAACSGGSTGAGGGGISQTMWPGLAERSCGMGLSASVLEKLLATNAKKAKASSAKPTKKMASLLKLDSSFSSKSNPNPRSPKPAEPAFSPDSKLKAWGGPTDAGGSGLAGTGAGGSCVAQSGTTAGATDAAGGSGVGAVVGCANHEDGCEGCSGHEYSLGGTGCSDKPGPIPTSSDKPGATPTGREPAAQLQQAGKAHTTARTATATPTQRKSKPRRPAS
mmetsp:Transcript_90028/g.165165  ORF Transcript_90028/g.165165 Transcript_90028/m.165165 type:complete len:290 (-) Transcript_90028:160-1029(-)